MGLTLFGTDVGAAVDNVWGDISKTAVPAAEAGAEQFLANQLSSMSQANTQAAQQGVAQIMNAPGPASGIITSIEGVVKNIASSTVYQQYGGYIVMGIIGLVVVGHFFGRD